MNSLSQFLISSIFKHFLLCTVYITHPLHVNRGIRQTRAFVSMLRFYYLLNSQKLRIALNSKYRPLFIPVVVTLTSLEMKYKLENAMIKFNLYINKFTPKIRDLGTKRSALSPSLLPTQSGYQDLNYSDHTSQTIRNQSPFYQLDPNLLPPTSEKGKWPLAGTCIGRAAVQGDLRAEPQEHEHIRTDQVEVIGKESEKEQLRRGQEYMESPRTKEGKGNERKELPNSQEGRERSFCLNT